jgi:hypothetical protein
MPAPRPQNELAAEVAALNERQADVTNALRADLASERGAELIGACNAFRVVLGLDVPIGYVDLGTDVGERAAGSILGLLGAHPAFGGDGPGDLALPVFGEYGRGEGENGFGDALGLRDDAARAIAIGGAAIGVLSVSDPAYGAIVVRVAVGPDDLSGLIRGVMLGKPFPDDLEPHIPDELLDLMNDIDRRTCGAGIVWAVNQWGLAAASSPRFTSWATGISSLSPSVGCAGTHVMIHGSGFGSAPQGTEIYFPRRGGGCTPATVVSWTDTGIEAVAPTDVGAGCVGFVSHSGSDSGELVSAASTLAGELERCLGMAGSHAAQVIEQSSLHPLFSCPPCLAGGVNYFAGGRPVITFFGANGGPAAEVAPGGVLTLTWAVDNATSVQIVPITTPANELPQVLGPISAKSGTYVFPALNGTFTWDGEYELQARNGCTPPTQPELRRVTVRMRSKPDLTVGGIEVTQATQFFNAATHMPNPAARQPDNAVPLIAGKPTIARVFVDSGQLASFDKGVVKGVKARLHGRGPNGVPLPGSPLAPLDPTFKPNAAYTIDPVRRSPLTASIVASERLVGFPGTSFHFLLPSSWTSSATIELEAEVIPPGSVVERDATNNKLEQTATFNSGGLPLKIALLFVTYTDVDGTTVPPPSAAAALADLDFIQRVYPSNRSLLNVVLAPGGPNPWTFGGNLDAGGPGCGLGWNLVNAELAVRAFYSFGNEDRVWVALLTPPPSGKSNQTTGCGTPMAALGAGPVAGIIIGTYFAATLLLGPFAGPALAAIMARLGTAALGVCSALATPLGAVPDGTLAQEIGHAFGLFHIDGTNGAPPPFESGWPDYEGVGSAAKNFESIGEFGLDVDDSMALTLRSHAPFSPPSLATADFMSYASLSDWVSPFIYERVMRGAIVPPVGAGPAPAPLKHHDEVEPLDCALVCGSIEEDGSAMLRPVYVHRRPIRIERVDDDHYHLELRADDGQVLASNGVVPVDHPHGEELEPGFTFAIALPWHPRARTLALLRRGSVLASMEIAEEAPEVAEPRVAQTEGGWLVEWTAKHEEQPHAMLRYATGDEDLWQLLAWDVAEASYMIEDGVLPGGKTRIQVGASAGGVTAWATSAPFDVEPPPARVEIAAPQDGASIRHGHSVQLRGYAFLPGLRSLADDAYSWRSDRDGELGNGSRVDLDALSLGPHELTLVVREEDRPEASATVRVVVDQGEPLVAELELELEHDHEATRAIAREALTHEHEHLRSPP